MTHFKLSDQTTFEIDADGGGNLYISRPQRIIKLSRGGVRAVQQLIGDEQADLSPPVLDFAQNLEDQGVITRSFPTLEDEKLPSVSIVIPTYGRPQMLAGCLESLAALDYPQEKLEIIVVDDASPQPLSSANWAPGVKLLRMTQNSGPGEARNRAVLEAKGEIIAFLDDDCLADKSWLRALVPCFQYPEVAIAGGEVAAAEVSNSLGKYEQVRSPLCMGTFQRKVRKGSAISYLPTCNLLIRKTSFLLVGGFDSSLRLGEDVDLCWRVLESGASIYYQPTGVVYHYHRTSLLPFLKRRYNYGQSEAKLQEKHHGGNRRLSLFPGHGYCAGAALVIAMVLGIMLGMNLGLFLGLTSLIILDVFNFVGQVIFQRFRMKASGYQRNFGQLARAIIRAHNSAIYLYCQNFSRYYSIILTLLALPLFPGVAVLFLFLQLWPALVDYRLKKPDVARVKFCLFYVLENYFYQAGVLNGCFREHNWRPLVMELRSAEEVLA